jgi:hypothetical protein
MTSYIGVTGIMTPEESQTLAAFAATSPRRVMLGVLSSAKTLRGEPNKWPLRFPPKTLWNSLAIPAPNVCYALHVAIGSDEPHLVVRQAITGAEGYTAIQLNGAWPAEGVLSSINDEAQDYEIILQINPGSINACRGDTDYETGVNIGRKLIAYLDEDDGLTAPFDHVLLDASGGLGKGLDPVATLHMLNGIYTTFSPRDAISVGIAGGFCAETLPAVADILKAYPAVSIDAEGRLRDDAPGGGHMVFSKVESYLNVAKGLLRVDNSSQAE